MPDPAAAAPWWKSGVIYQVYPRSFQDSNGDGVGDLDGIVRRLDYLKDLGVDAVWLSPVYRSPMADFGYDVSDYTAIDPLFGDMAAFQRLIRGVHARGLKLIMDFVPNHTSDQHPWFLESRASRGAARRDWYIWRDPAPFGGAPNNWLSEFGGSAWEYDAASGQYYYHAFLKEQPDLNWRNPQVVEAMLDVLRFWLDLGVDGFRVDAIHNLIKDDLFRDNPDNQDWVEGMDPADRRVRLYTTDRPQLHAAVATMRRVVDAYPREGVLIGEAYLPIDRLVTYYGGALEGFHLPFNFHLLITAWRPEAIAGLIKRYEASLPAGGWPNWVLGNHDRARLASRIGAQNVPLAAMLLLSLRGTPTLYQGDELGMSDVDIPSERVRDPWEINVPGAGLGRDPVRTPMLWSGEPFAGFSTEEPWLPLSPDWREINVERQSGDPGSLLSLYRDLLGLRRAYSALSVGEITDVFADERLLRFRRRHESGDVEVVLNFSAEAVVLPNVAGRLLLSTAPYVRLGPFEDGLTLAKREGVIFHQPFRSASQPALRPIWPERVGR